jgi:hypothetical protein
MSRDDYFTWAITKMGKKKGSKKCGMPMERLGQILSSSRAKDMDY